MAAPIPLRGDFDASQLRVLARKSKDGPQARRLLALAAIYEGARRSEAAKIGGVGLQIIRDWDLRFNARGPAGLLDGKAPGQPPKLNDAQRQAVARMSESGPIAAVHGVVRWRLIDLAQWIFEEFRITIAAGGTQRPKNFIEWAAHYDDGTREGKNLDRHQAWLESLSCPVMRLDGTRATSAGG